jgi:hypothetical protein
MVEALSEKRRMESAKMGRSHLKKEPLKFGNATGLN